MLFAYIFVDFYERCHISLTQYGLTQEFFVKKPCVKSVARNLIIDVYESPRYSKRRCFMALKITAENARVTLSFNPLDPIGSILDNIRKKVEKTVEDVTNTVHDASVDIIVKAGEQALNIIASLKAAYADSLELTYQKVDKLMRENIDRLDDLATDVINKNEEALEKIADRIEDIVKFSPLSNWWLPLLSNVSPNFFAVDASNSDGSSTITMISIVFTGNFAYADRPGCTPTFKLGDQVYQPTANTTKKLTFHVDISSNNPQIHMHRYAFLKGCLSVIWKSGYLPWSWTTSEYNTMHGMLPGSPGKITIVYTKAESIIKQTVRSNVVNVIPNKKHWQTNQLVLGPDKGWHVIRGSSALHWLERHGQTGDKFISDDHEQVIYEYSNKDGSGKVQVVFDESQTIPVQQRREEKTDLRWGSSWIPTPNAGEKITSIMLEAFNGDVFQFQPRTDRTNRFIELREFDGSIQIQAKRAGDLNIDSLNISRMMFATQSNEI
jgi:hypothetical protein